MPEARCEHEFTLNVQLTHAWCQKCYLVIPMIADGVIDTIRGRARAAARERFAAVIAPAQLRFLAILPDVRGTKAEGDLHALADLLDDPDA